MKRYVSSTGKLVVIGLLLLCLAAFISGCKGGDGVAGPAGVNGQDAAYGPGCVNCHHISDQTLNIFEATAPSGLATSVTATPGTPIKLTAKSVFSNGTATVNSLGYFWEFQGGLNATIQSTTVTGASLTVTITSGQDYRAALVAAEKIPDRTMIVPVNGFSQELATKAMFKLWVYADDGKIYYNVAKVTANDNDLSKYAPALSAGINNVPVNLPVLLNARGDGPYTWSIVTNPSTTTLYDASTKNPYFIPDTAGEYVLNVITTPTGTTVSVTDTLTIYAGTWEGVITGIDTSGKPNAGNCSCHSTIADEWKNTGHAHILSSNIEDTAGHWGLSCGGCHSVGYNTSATNGGFDEFADTAFTDTNQVRDTTKWYPPYSIVNGKITTHGEAGSWAAMVADYPSAAKLANIQCENCHGPQNGASGSSHNSDTNHEERISLSSDVCGQCHGSPTHHGRFQEWQQSPTGHASFELAEGEGMNNKCAGCHSAQGYLIWIEQLKAGNPLRDIPSAKVIWTADNVQPQTCAVCHDPHAIGSTTNLDTDAEPRITGDTPKLPAGFAALGVGKGAQCIICHNTRNGGKGSTAADGTTTGNSYLHEDNDPVFGSVLSATSYTSYALPHAPSQGDVLMGHNAYFMGDSGGNTSKYKSPHATITDTCVNCHMNKSLPPVEYSDYHNTNHTFKANLESCTSCHGISSGLGPKLQGDTKVALEELLHGIQNAIISRAAGTYAGKIATVEVGESHGGVVLDLTYNDGTAAAADVPIAEVLPLKTVSDRNVAKALWNYNLIHNDGSFGIHNPGYVRDVLGNTIMMVEELY